jgi:hypothetical protein
MNRDKQVPSYSQLCWRQARLPKQPAHIQVEAIHLVVDSTGLKVYGEGEWKVRQHGIVYPILFTTSWANEMVS